MDIRFPRLWMLARRMVPGVHMDPAMSIGTCLHCGRDVTYAAGDRDAAGRARHDRCESAAIRRDATVVRAGCLLAKAARLLRQAPSVRPRLAQAIRGLPNDHGPVDMLRVVADMRPHLELDATLGLSAKAAVARELRGIERDLAALAASPSPN